jgi:hypothetical protein
MFTAVPIPMVLHSGELHLCIMYYGLRRAIKRYVNKQTIRHLNVFLCSVFVIVHVVEYFHGLHDTKNTQRVVGNFPNGRSLKWPKSQMAENETSLKWPKTIYKGDPL